MRKPVVPMGRPPDPAAVASPSRTPCLYEGYVDSGCKTCGQGGKTRGCDLHGVCTREKVAGKSLRVCAVCPDYVPDPTLLPKVPAGIVIPPVPPFELTPRRRTAVVTVASGPVGRDLLAVTGPSMIAFADRVGSDFVVVTWPGHPAWPMSAKYAIPLALDQYERILYADADVLFRPGCVNPFDLCDASEMGVVDELAYHRLHPRFRREAEYQAFRRRMGFKDRPHLPWYFNAGVMVVPQSHRAILEPPAGPIIPGHCAEQDHTNARLLDSGLPYRLLDRRANWQHWHDPAFRAAPADAVLHWSGGGHDHAGRLAAMAAMASG